MKELNQRLRRLHGKPYGVYKSLAQQPWPFGDFHLEFVHVQGDPFAPPSRLLLRGKLAALGFSPDDFESLDARRALADLLLRRCGRVFDEIHLARGGEGKPALDVVRPGPEILDRNTLQIVDDHIYVVLRAQLPGDGRRIDADQALEVLVNQLSEASTDAFYKFNIPSEELLRHRKSLERQVALRAQLAARGLVAFVADDAVLPRASGAESAPLLGAEPFSSPADLRVELEFEGSVISGMGIPRGITVLAGGAYQGKSTLLKAIESGIHDHIPGDGRECVVTLPQACRVRVEEGRPVAGTCIQPLVRWVPGADVARFITANASGSTSQAANLMEAVEMGGTPLLIDEDASAVNFLIRDTRMRALVSQEGEPLVPLVDRIRAMKRHWGLDFVIVAGACGDFLAVADTVVVLDRWQPRNATAQAREICANTPARIQIEEPQEPLGRAPLRKAVELEVSSRLATNPKDEVKIKIGDAGTVRMGGQQSDTGAWSGFACDEQRRTAAALAAKFLRADAARSGVLREALERLAEGNWKTIVNHRNMDLAAVRGLEVAALLFRLRS